MVGHTLRFDPRYYLAKRELADGHIGDAIHAYARRNNLLANARRIGGRTSVAMFLGVHDLDVLMWVMESDLTSFMRWPRQKRLGTSGSRMPLSRRFALLRVRLESLKYRGCCRTILSPYRRTHGDHRD
jgi:UDP-N-acetylglucosamine 3-dehydrogenase